MVNTLSSNCVLCSWIFFIISISVTQAALSDCSTRSIKLDKTPEIIKGYQRYINAYHACWRVEATKEDTKVLVEVLNVTFHTTFFQQNCQQQRLLILDGNDRDGYKEEGRFCDTTTTVWTYTSSSGCCIIIDYFVQTNYRYTPVPFYIRVSPNQFATEHKKYQPEMAGYWVGGIVAFILIVILAFYIKSRRVCQTHCCKRRQEQQRHNLSPDNWTRGFGVVHTNAAAPTAEEQNILQTILNARTLTRDQGQGLWRSSDPLSSHRPWSTETLSTVDHIAEPPPVYSQIFVVGSDVNHGTSSGTPRESSTTDGNVRMTNGNNYQHGSISRERNPTTTISDERPRQDGTVRISAGNESVSYRSQANTNPAEIASGSEYRRNNTISQTGSHAETHNHLNIAGRHSDGERRSLTHHVQQNHSHHLPVIPTSPPPGYTEINFNIGATQPDAASEEFVQNVSINDNVGGLESSTQSSSSSSVFANGGVNTHTSNNDGATSAATTAATSRTTVDAVADTPAAAAAAAEPHLHVQVRQHHRFSTETQMTPPPAYDDSMQIIYPPTPRQSRIIQERL